MENSLDPDQTAPIGAVCSGSTLFASILNSSVILDNYLQRTTLADNIFFLARPSFLCMLGNFSCFCCRLLTFYKINFFKKLFQEHYQNVKQFCIPDWIDILSVLLGSYCLQMLSADNKNSSYLGWGQICLIQYFEADFPKILNSGLILNAFIHEYVPF